jgi:hypothetical protein
MRSTTRQGQLVFALATAAVLWSLLLVVGAFLFPAYSGGSCQAGTGIPATCTHQTQTFVEVNGAHAALWFVCVFVFAGTAWLFLHAKCAYGLPGAAGLGQLCAGAIFLFSVVASASIGFFVAPVAMLLFVASLRTPHRAQSAPR